MSHKIPMYASLILFASIGPSFAQGAEEHPNLLVRMRPQFAVACFGKGNVILPPGSPCGCDSLGKNCSGICSKDGSCDPKE